MQTELINKITNEQKDQASVFICKKVLPYQYPLDQCAFSCQYNDLLVAFSKPMLLVITDNERGAIKKSSSMRRLKIEHECSSAFAYCIEADGPSALVTFYAKCSDILDSITLADIQYFLILLELGLFLLWEHQRIYYQKLLLDELIF